MTTSSTTIGVANLAAWLARSTAFQELCGLTPGDHAGAAIRVYPYGLTPTGADVFTLDNLQDLRPLAVITPDPSGQSATRVADASWVSTEAFQIHIEFDIAGQSVAEAAVVAHDAAPSIRNEIFANSAAWAGERIQPKMIRSTVYRSEVEEADGTGTYWMIDLSVET